MKEESYKHSISKLFNIIAEKETKLDDGIFMRIATRNGRLDGYTLQKSP